MELIKEKILESKEKNILNSFQIQLSKDVNNDNIEELCKGLYNYKGIFSRINFDKNFHSLLFNNNQNCFEMIIKKESTNFFIHTKDNIEKIKNLYKRYYPTCNFFDKKNNFELEKKDYLIEYNLKEPYFKSLKTNKKDLQPLSCLMDLQLILEDNESVIYQLILNSIDSNWGIECEQKKNEYKDKEESLLEYPKKIKPLEICKFLLSGIGLFITEFLNFGLEMFFNSPEQLTLDNNKTIDFSKETKTKSKYMAFNTTIRVIIKSDNIERKNIIKSLVDNAFSFLDNDNSLEGEIINFKEKTIFFSNFEDIYNRVMNRESIFNIYNKNILNIKEVGKLMTLPTKDLLSKYIVNKNVKSTNTTTLSPELYNGIVDIGLLVNTNTFPKVAFPIDPELYCLPKIVAGGMGSGKSNFSIGFINNSIKMKNTVIQFDYIDVCQIANTVAENNKDNCLRINPSQILNFSYPEINGNKTQTLREKALDYANCLIKLIDTLNNGSINDMTGRMKKIFRSAALVCYLTGNDNIKFVYKILTNVQYRKDLISLVPDEYLKTFKIYIDFLSDLTIIDKKTNEERNDDDAIKYILDRFDILMGDGNLLNMFENENSSINFQELLNSGKLITIEMPQSSYRHKWVKDVIVCYLLHRIWIACENRNLKDRKIVDIILDEVHQLNNTKNLISDFACETRKFRISFLFCCQFFNQFKTLRESIEGGTVHYILLAGSKPSNFEDVESLIENFTLKDFTSLPKYHSFNIILTKQGYQTFVTKMINYSS